MYRPRHRRKSKLRRALTWATVLGVLALGVWQVAKFRGALIDDANKLAKPVTSADATTSKPVEHLSPGAPALPRPDVYGAPPIQVLPILSPQERSARIDRLLAGANAAFDRSRFLQTRAELNQALALLGEAHPAPGIREQLAALNTPVFFSSDIVPNDPYALTVPLAAGDNFPKLAQRYRVPAALLQKINPTYDPRKLKIGAAIKVIYGPFHGRFHKHARRLDLFARDMYVCSFAADIEQAFDLPTGDYRVKAAGKVQFASRQWIGVEGVDPDTRSIRNGWIYGSAGTRAGAADRRRVGLLVSDSDLQTMYNALVENDSQLHVEP